MLTKEELKNKLEDLLKEYQSYSKEEKEGMSEDDIDRQTSIESLTPEGHMKRADYSYPKIRK